MAVVVEELPTVERSFGIDANDLVLVADSFRHRFVVEDDSPPCTPADFAGYTPSFDILDSTGAVVLSGTAVPNPGDATGTFQVDLTPAQTTTLGEGTYAYRLQITDGSFTITLFCGAFVLSVCKAA